MTNEQARVWRIAYREHLQVPFDRQPPKFSSGCLGLAFLYETGVNRTRLGTVPELDSVPFEC
jgi:hypothetical protein